MKPIFSTAYCWKTLAASAVSITVASTGTAIAQEKWEYTGFLYLWGSALGGETTSGDSIDVSFSDLVDKLDFGLMGTIEANKGSWSLFADVMYLNLSDDDDASVGPGISASADADIDGLVFTGGVGYSLVDNNTSKLHGLGGLRHLNMDTTVNIDGPSGSQRINDTLSNWDAIVGIKGVHTLADRWSLLYYADVGAGDSDLTWQAAVAIDFEINKWSLNFGYRHLEWDIDNSPNISNISFSGPFIGARYRF